MEVLLAHDGILGAAEEVFWEFKLLEFGKVVERREVMTVELGVLLGAVVELPEFLAPRELDPE